MADKPDRFYRVGYQMKWDVDTTHALGALIGTQSPGKLADGRLWIFWSVRFELYLIIWRLRLLIEWGTVDESTPLE